MKDLTKLQNAQERVRALYDPKTFKMASEAISKELTHYFENSLHTKKVRNWKSPQDLLNEIHKILKKPLAESTKVTEENFSDLARFFLSHAHNLHCPHYMGHQVPPPLVAAGPFDLLASATNQPPGLYEMGPFAAMSERGVFQKMAELIGWSSETTTAIGTSGGSIANLTAVLAARNHRYKDYWQKGPSSVKGLRPAVVTSDDSHYSVSRALGVLGLGTDQLITVPIDEKRRMDVNALRRVLEKSKKEGFDIFCIIATSGTTPVGAFDPLREIAQVAKEHGIWLHVDGAHGGSVLFSKEHRHLVDGIENADSVTWDAHKLLYVPALSTFLFFKDKKTSYTTFEQDAPYLHDPANPLAHEFDTVSRTLECTKHSIATSLWGLWSLYGSTIFEDLVDVVFARTGEFYEILKESSDFVPLNQPECNILCFKHVPGQLKNKSSEEISQFQKTIRERLLHEGNFYTTGTRLDDSYALRVTLMNPLIEKNHLHSLLEDIRKIGEDIS